MRARRGILGGVGAIVLALAACSGSDPSLMNISPGDTDGPDEFSILPNAPLERPATTELPTPDPGGPSRADPDPRGDAAVALGGRRDSGGAVPAADGAVVAHAARFGRQPQIRAQLAAEDEAYRRRNQGRLLERIFNRNTYYQAYAPMSLDTYAELERWRAAEVRTPGAPPRSR